MKTQEEQDHEFEVIKRAWPDYEVTRRDYEPESDTWLYEGILRKDDPK